MGPERPGKGREGGGERQGSIELRDKQVGSQFDFPLPSSNFTSIKQASSLARIVGILAQVLLSVPAKSAVHVVLRTPG